MLTLDDLRRFLKGEATVRTAAPAADAARPRIGPPAKLTPPAGAGTAAAPQTGEFARRLMTIAGFGDSTRWSREKVLLGLDAGEAAVLPNWIDVFLPRPGVRPFNLVVLESTSPASAEMGKSLFRKLEGESRVEDALERVCQAALKGFAHGSGKAFSRTRPVGIPGDAQTLTVVVASIRDDRFDDEADQDNPAPVHLMMFATRIGTDEEIKAGEGLETFIVRQECARWEPQLFEEYTERVFKRHFERLAKPGTEWREAFVIEEERKKAAALRKAATNPREQLRLLGSASNFERKLQETTVALLEEVARGFGLRPKNGKLLECLDLPKGHDIAADPDALDRGEPNPLPGIIVRDQTNRLLGYIVYCLDSKVAVEVLRERLRVDNCFHNVLVIFPDLSGPAFELWQGTDKLDASVVSRGAVKAADAALISLLTRFFVVGRNRISDPAELAGELAKRARFLRRLAERQLADERSETVAEKQQLTTLYAAFKGGLSRAMKLEDFADAYAQTLTYGLLSARWISKDELKEAARTRKAGAPVPQFTRAYAQAHLNSTSPLLQALFEKVLSEKFEPKLAWLLDDIAALLNQVTVDHVFDPKRVKSELSSDPVIHFYEPFLAAYNPEIRQRCGVYYTPERAVQFIVRSVDEEVQRAFGLQDGLAATEKWEAGPKAGQYKVQILDPAIGTGTFLKEVILLVWRRKLAAWRAAGRTEEDVRGEWRVYVRDHLAPRLFGFELMVASYVICHLKLTLVFRETGIAAADVPAIIVCLTNALQDPGAHANTLPGAEFLSIEAEKAIAIKTDHAISVVIGNPPYSESVYEDPWILGLMRAYKDGLGETKSDLNREEWKFMRFAEWRTADSPAAVIGVIINRSFLDGVSNRVMRKHLGDSFPARLVLDLHGDVKGKQVQSEAGPDANVFDITQGVAVCCLARGQLASSHQYLSISGPREQKLARLASLTPAEARSAAASCQPCPSFFLWVSSGGEPDALAAYSTWPTVSEVFSQYSSGIQSGKDRLCFSYGKDEMLARVRRFALLGVEAARQEFALGEDTDGWAVGAAKADLDSAAPSASRVTAVLYRPFDVRYTYYTTSSGGFLKRPRRELMRHFVGKDNIGLIVNRQVVSDRVTQFGASAIPICHGTFYLGNKGQDYLMPLYVYPDGAIFDGGRALTGRSHNLSSAYVGALARSTGMRFVADGHGDLAATFGPEDIFNFLLSMGHSEGYRSTFDDPLHRDFPRFPATASAPLFGALARVGSRVRQAWTLSDNVVADVDVSFVDGGDRVVQRLPKRADALPKDTSGRPLLHINSKSHFIGVTPELWQYEGGGYQVLHKWLEARQKEKLALAASDVIHFRRIVTALRLLSAAALEIDSLVTADGGWPGAFAEKP